MGSCSGTSWAAHRRAGLGSHTRLWSRERPFLLSGGFPVSPAVQDILCQPIDRAVTPLGHGFQGPLCLTRKPECQARVLLHGRLYQA
jgi:hypothetical protein